MENQKISENQLEFAIFCVENLAAFYHVDGKRMYDALTVKSDILKDYIIPEYEVLHSQGKSYIVDELSDVIRERGVKV